MTFEDLEAWPLARKALRLGEQQARQLVNAIYGLTRGTDLSRDFGLTSQVQRAAVSIMSNVLACEVA